MTSKANNTETSQKGSTYYDEIFSRIQEMEKKYFEDDINQFCNEFLKNYKPSNNSFDIFSSYGNEIPDEIIKA